MASLTITEQREGFKNEEITIYWKNKTSYFEYKASVDDDKLICFVSSPVEDTDEYSSVYHTLSKAKMYIKTLLDKNNLKYSDEIIDKVLILYQELQQPPLDFEKEQRGQNENK